MTIWHGRVSSRHKRQIRAASGKYMISGFPKTMQSLAAARRQLKSSGAVVVENSKGQG